MARWHLSYAFTLHSMPSVHMDHTLKRGTVLQMAVCSRLGWKVLDA